MSTKPWDSQEALTLVALFAAPWWVWHCQQQVPIMVIKLEPG